MLYPMVPTIVPAHRSSVSLQDLVDDMCPADGEHVEDVVPVGTTLFEVTHSPDVSFDVLVPLTVLGKQGTGFLPIRCVRHHRRSLFREVEFPPFQSHP